jgi:hypothetical protein
MAAALNHRIFEVNLEPGYERLLFAGVATEWVELRQIPMWLSWIAVIVAGGLGHFGFRSGSAA